jgi:hypothetical protein
MPETDLEIIIKPAYRKFSYIYIPAEYTGLFPPGKPKTKTAVRIDTGPSSVKAELQYNSRAHI